MHTPKEEMMGKTYGIEVGQVYEKLTVIEKRGKGFKWKCRCQCGKEIYCQASYLAAGRSKSCQFCKGKVLVPGQRFGRLVLIEKTRVIYTTLRLAWICKCDCGNTKTVLQTNLLKGFTVSCGCLHKEKMAKINNRYFGRLSGDHFSRIQRLARDRGYDLQVDMEFLWNLFLKQKEICALSNWPIHLGSKPTASLDRIDNDLGYVAGNLWWVHKDINRMKNDHTLEDFYKTCKDVATALFHRMKDKKSFLPEYVTPNPLPPST
jgi:hypothetical protein